MRHDAARLLDQQLWCWGRDISHPEGNLLLRLGMCRYRPAFATRDGTLYTARVGDSATIHLWGFGIYFVDAEHGGLFLRRGSFRPRMGSRPDALGLHTAEQVEASTRPLPASASRSARKLIEGFARWVAQYEHWIAETLGVTYRRDCLTGWDKKPVCEAKAMASRWEEVGRKAIRLLQPPLEGPTGPWDALLVQLRAQVRQVPWERTA
jgi:hypothetical protein